MQEKTVDEMDIYAIIVNVYMLRRYIIITQSVSMLVGLKGGRVGCRT